MCLDFSSAVLWNISQCFFLEGAIYEKTKRQLYLKSSEARERSKDPMVVYKARFEEHFGGVDELKRGRPALVVDGDGPAVLVRVCEVGVWRVVG